MKIWLIANNKAHFIDQRIIHIGQRNLHIAVIGLKAANKNSEFDISEQLSYYLVYLTNFLIRNEAKALNIKSGKQIRNVLKSITKNEDVHKASKAVKLSKLPVHTKIIVCMLRLKSVVGLKAYTKLFGKYLKKGK